MPSIMNVIATETKGKSFQTFKYGLDSIGVPNFTYDDSSGLVWEQYGETGREENHVDLTNRAKSMVKSKPIFTYFLDGSRRTYKVDDISYKNQVFPVIAGQIGIGCCKRQDRQLSNERFEARLIITLPKDASDSDWSKELFFKNLLIKVNEESSLKKRNLQFSDIKYYSYKKDEMDKLENKGIAVVQDLMIECEKNMVSTLAKEGTINFENYLMKDGSLEYVIPRSMNERNLQRYRQSYRWVVGVSKSFNPGNCIDKNKRIISNKIAQLPLFHRTPVNMYYNPRIGNVKFAVWYVRIRDAKYTASAFDGILKIEKMLVTDNEESYGIDTEEANNITANIINERNPVCYGKDFRWANHLYPVYLTETMVKSHYLSNNLFLNLF